MGGRDLVLLNWNSATLPFSVWSSLLPQGLFCSLQVFFSGLVVFAEFSFMCFREEGFALSSYSAVFFSVPIFCYSGVHISF